MRIDDRSTSHGDEKAECTGILYANYFVDVLFACATFPTGLRSAAFSFVSLASPAANLHVQVEESEYAIYEIFLE